MGILRLTEFLKDTHIPMGIAMEKDMIIQQYMKKQENTTKISSTKGGAIARPMHVKMKKTKKKKKK